jgi:hypothetical protein
LLTDEFFLGSSIVDSSGAASWPPLYGNSSPRFVTVRYGAQGGSASPRCREAYDAIPSGSYLAIVIPLEEHGLLRRMVSLLALSSRLTAAEQILSRCGAILAGRYGVFPDLRVPTILFRLGSSASRYAEEHLLQGTTRWPLSALRPVLRCWAGCDPSLGAVLVIGRKP